MTIKSLLDTYDKAYYQDNISLVPDHEYDALKALLDDDRVGHDPDTRLQKVAHAHPMLSLKNSFSQKDLEKFYDTVNSDVLVQPKIDGLSLSLIYKNGRLVQAVTRGNGIEGEDVTHNLLVISNIKFFVERKDVTEIRGEVFMSKETFKNDFPGASNARNSASGILRRKESYDKIVLSFLPFDVFGVDFVYESEKIKFLKDCGYDTFEDESFIASSLSSISSCCDVIEQKKNDYPYEIDGVVLKCNSIEKQDDLGFRSTSPKWATSFKFTASGEYTTLLDVEYTVGKHGTVTPVGKLEPVEIDGVMVENVSLHNKDFIAALDLHIGDIVEVCRSGDVIPYVRAIDASQRLSNAFPVVYPTKCLCCLSELIFEDVLVRCGNPDCSEQLLQKLIFIVSKHALDIRGVSEKALRALVENGSIEILEDIFNLKKSDLLELPGWKDKRIENYYKEISKPFSAKQIVSALCIPGIGPTNAKAIIEHYKNLENVFNDNGTSLLDANGFGEETVNNIKVFLEDKNNISFFNTLKSIWYLQGNTLEDTSADKDIIVFSGKFTRPRKELIAMLDTSTHQVGDSITKQTSLLVSNETTTSKVKKANKLGVTILSEADYVSTYTAS